MDRRFTACLGLAAVLVLGACSSDDTPDTTAAPVVETTAAAETTSAVPETTAAAAETTAVAAVETTAAAAAASATPVDLAAVCPNPIVVQTDWYPSPEHGYTYALIGKDGTLDTEKGIYRGPLKGSNVDLEIRAGGPYLGYQQVSALMAQDPSIFLGYVNTDEAVQQSGKIPTVAVMAPLAKNPQILMWRPETYQFKTFADIGKSDATVLSFGGAVFIDYLVSTGQLRKEQIDASYDGTPARFAADPKIVQQGFATSEPWLYENEIKEYAKPVGSLLVDDSGLHVYSQTLSVKAADVTAKADCLKQLVPLFQKSVVDHYADPKPTSDLIVDIATKQNKGWVLYPEQMQFSVDTALKLGIVANGTDGAVGSMDAARMDEVVKTLVPLLDKEGGNVKKGLVATDLYTDDFIDPSIALPAS